MNKYNEIHDIVYDAMIATRLNKCTKLFLDTLAHKIARILFVKFHLDDETKILGEDPHLEIEYSPNAKLLADLKK